MIILSMKQWLILQSLEKKACRNIMNISGDYFPHIKLILIILLHFKKYNFRKKWTIALCSDRRQVRKAFQNNFTPFNLKKYFADNWERALKEALIGILTAGLPCPITAPELLHNVSCNKECAAHHRGWRAVSESNPWQEPLLVMTLKVCYIKLLGRHKGSKLFKILIRAGK